MDEILEIIYKHLSEQENNRLITIEKTGFTSISSIEYAEFISKYFTKKVLILLTLNSFSPFYFPLLFNMFVNW